VLAARSVVFVLRRNVQLVEPEVRGPFNDGIIFVMNALKQLSNGFEQWGATDIPACAA
jgi:hypothetical protein